MNYGTIMADRSHNFREVVLPASERHNDTGCDIKLQFWLEA